MSKLELKGISKQYGATEVLTSIDLDVADGEMVGILGPSGCGKSTLLRIVAGLVSHSTGKVLIGGRDVTNLSLAQRGIAMVFQSYALYPHLTVEGNLTLGLKQMRTPKEIIAERVAEAARMLELTPFLRRHPAQLSGGQRQRVAIGRAIVRHPDVFLFDEPLSNLDAALRSQVRTELSDLHRRLAATMLYVTHDQAEAMTLAQRIVVMDRGIVQQVGTPSELYRRPANLFVAGFIGSPRMNMLNGRIVGRAVEVPGLGTLPCTPNHVGALMVGVRPNGFAVGDGGAEGPKGTLVSAEYLGSESFLRVRLSDETIITVAEHADHSWVEGQTLSVAVRPRGLHLFDAATGNRVPFDDKDIGGLPQERLGDAVAGPQ